jgi:hypothetical protein
MQAKKAPEKNGLNIILSAITFVFSLSILNRELRKYLKYSKDDQFQCALKEVEFS